MADAEGAPDEYAQLTEQLAAQPFSRELHTHRLALALAHHPDHLELTRAQYAAALPLPEPDYAAWITTRTAALPARPVDDVQPFLDLVDLFRTATRDYPASVPLLAHWASWTVANYYAAHGIAPPPNPQDRDDDDDEDAAMQPATRESGSPDDLLQVVFSLDEVRATCQETLALGGTHLAESSKLWTIWRDFEVDLLKMYPTPDQLVQVEQLYLARLKVPHLDIAETFSAYSSFVTAFDNDNYDKALPAANKIFSATARKSDERYPEEEKLKAAGYTAQAYMDYIAWEREVKRPDTPLVKALFERAARDHPLDHDVWEAYLEWLHKIPEKDANLLQVAQRATRFLPSSSTLWTSSLRISEKLSLASDAIEALFQQAFATRLFDKDMDAVVALYHARASYYRREMERREASAEGSDGPDAELVGFALGVLQEGIETTKRVHKKGDPQTRLEKYLIRLYERFHMVDEARALWESLTKARPNSYAVWYGRADFETRMGAYATAHSVYTAGCSERGLDYPEYLLDAWVAFELECGTLADVEFALAKSKRQRKGLERRRAREAAEAAAKAAASAPADADSFIASAVQGSGASTSAGEGSKKRERSPGAAAGAAAAGGEQGNKKVRVHEPEEQKRDREHSTVFAISSGPMSDDDVRQLFRDCGEIRELHVKEIGGKTYAQIEFMEKESVLAAQTKDKKRVHSLEIEVYIAWQSCLYVTNYPESYDKEAVERLFEKYGTIFDTRWPSKRFKNTRRFCYVQFANPAHAQAALELNGTELEPGHALSVLISDPSRKKSRSDANAHQRELYVASLAKSVKEADLRKLFEPCGPIVGVRVPQDDKGFCKGFAFVEFEDEASAQAALALNNHELKKRHMSVTIAQPRATGTGKFGVAGSTTGGAPGARVETENRGIRVKGLLPDTQEAIIQQEFEKLAPVRMVNYVAGSTEAVVLLENPGDVGKLLMQHDTLTIASQPVQLSAENRSMRPPRSVAPSTTTPDGASLMPRQAGRGRGGRGRGRVGLGAGRGGGRGGAAFVAARAQSGASPSGVGESGEAQPKAENRSQDDFRAMLLKK
ncbi:hypothetical protein Rhopal_007229-T1 [Rhodotorula paludigena]|uniref:U4/U6 snRNA-associated-splicing factor PRP24 n=1 Tax=Rhodotorula paludigena TaxID=86838 RepID=A0AAV5GXG1_9BASI|nr:hypothetical protein Rhopal_007229-T1 [Rhodotorula paludigena]